MFYFVAGLTDSTFQCGFFTFKFSDVINYCYLRRHEFRYAQRTHKTERVQIVCFGVISGQLAALLKAASS